MKTSASSERIQQSVGSRVRNFISGSPLRRRRAFSIDSGLSTAGSPVFGVPLDSLVTSQSDKIPKIIKRVVEHVEKQGLREEGLYRINGSSKIIDRLKASFNSIGDADFTNVEIAAIAGLLKLFLRELPAAVIPSDVESQLVEIQQNCPGEATPDIFPQLRDCLSKLPLINYAVLKFLISHLTKVADHSDDNKMTPVSLSIIFGPNLFHCSGGLEGMRQQGYANSILCKLILHSTQLFHPPPPADQIGERPAKPELGSPTSPPAVESPERSRSYSERSVDEAIEQSSDNLHPSSPSPSSPLPPQVSSPSHPLSPSSPPHGSRSDEVFQRRQPVKKVRRPKMRSWSADFTDSPSVVTTTSSSPAVDEFTSCTTPPPSTMRDEESLHHLSPFSSHASSLSPSGSPSSSPSLTPRSSKAISEVIEGTVKQYLFGPSLPRQLLPQETKSSGKKVHTDVYGLLLPDQYHSPTAKKKNTHPPKSHDNHMTTSDVTVITSDPSGTTSVSETPRHDRSSPASTSSPSRRRGGRREGKEGGKREERRRNRRSVVVGSNEGEKSLAETEVQVLSVSPESKGDGSEVMVTESGRVSDLVRQFDETDGESQSAHPPREVPRKKKMASKEFDMFEKTGVIMGMPMPQAGRSAHSAPPSSTSTPHPTPESPPPPPSNITSHHPPSDPDTSLPLQQEAETKKKRKKSKLTSSLPLPDDSTQPVFTAEERPHTRREQRLASPPQPGELGESGGQKLTSLPQGGELGEAELQRLTSPPQAGELEDSGGQILTSSPQTGERKSRRKPREKKGTLQTEDLKEAVADSDGGGTLQHLTKTRPKGPANRRLPTKKQTAVVQEEGSSSTSPRTHHRHRQHLTEVAPEETSGGQVVHGWVNDEAPLDPPPPTTGETDPRPTDNHKHTDKDKKHLKTKEAIDHSGEGLKEDSLERRGRDDPSDSGSTQVLEAILGKLMDSLARKRRAADRPDRVEDMTPVQLSEEKHSVQRTLLHFEKVYGRPTTATDKEEMRPLYDRYREVKKQLSQMYKKTSTPAPQTQANTIPTSDQTLPSVSLLTSGLARSLPLESCPLSSSTSQLSHSAVDTHSSSSLSLSTVPSMDRVTTRRRRATDGTTTYRPLSDLHRLQEEALAEKKQLRKILRDFESQFLSLHGRGVTKEDRQPKQKEYRDYKAIKEKLVQLANEINKGTTL